MESESYRLRASPRLYTNGVGTLQATTIEPFDPTGPLFKDTGRLVPPLSTRPPGREGSRGRKSLLEVARIRAELGGVQAAARADSGPCALAGSAGPRPIRETFAPEAILKLPL